MQNLRDLCVVEYSAIQGCFNYNTLEAVIESNRRALAHGIQPEYVPIAITDTFGEGAALTRRLTEELLAHKTAIPRWLVDSAI